MENNKKLTKKEIVDSLIRDLAEVGYEASKKSLIYTGIGFGLVTGCLLALSCCKVRIKTDKD